MGIPGLKSPSFSNFSDLFMTANFSNITNYKGRQKQLSTIQGLDSEMLKEVLILIYIGVFLSEIAEL